MTDRKAWEAAAAKDLRGRSPDELVRTTPDGAPVTTYTALPTQGLSMVSIAPTTTSSRPSPSRSLSPATLWPAW